MAAYDIGEAFQIIEEEMIASMSRNLKRHLATEKKEGLNYTMWQAEQLAALNNFRQDNKKRFSGYFSTINDQIEEVLKKSYASGELTQEATILEAIKQGAKIYNYDSAKTLRGQFFKINERKLNALIDATKNDMAKAETAMLRTADDEYRKIIYNSQVYLNTGVGTLSQAVDMASKDFLSRGISCIEYANGARVGIDTYSRMALRTAQTRAYLQGESSKRDEWGVNTVIVNRRGVACPRCLKYVGKVFYDDVWGNSPVPDSKYPKLSEAIAGGLYHPNCKDVHTTYFEDISDPPKPMTKEEADEANRVYELEQRQRYNERQIRKYKRLSEGSVDPENVAKYKEKLEYWQQTQKEFVAANSDVLKRRSELEKIFKAPTSSQIRSKPAPEPDIIKHEHAWVEKITKNPTCTEKGEKVLVCSCGEEKKEFAPALGHRIFEVVTAPTCTQEGYTRKTCMVCGHVEKTDIKPALGHDFGDWVITREPTTAEYGRKQKVCNRCGEKKYTTIPKLRRIDAEEQEQRILLDRTKAQQEMARLSQDKYTGILSGTVTPADYPAQTTAISTARTNLRTKLDATTDDAIDALFAKHNGDISKISYDLEKEMGLADKQKYGLRYSSLQSASDPKSYMKSQLKAYRADQQVVLDKLDKYEAAGKKYLDYSKQVQDLDKQLKATRKDIMKAKGIDPDAMRSEIADLTSQVEALRKSGASDAKLESLLSNKLDEFEKVRARYELEGIKKTGTAAPRTKSAAILDSLQAHADSKKSTIENQLQRTARKLGVSEAEARQRVSEALTEITDGCDLGMRIRADNLEKVLSDTDGGFKNLFEVGRSGGCSNPSIRGGGEQNVFGFKTKVPGTAAAGDRPVYGMMIPKVDANTPRSHIEYINEGPGSWYGDGVTCVINKERVYHNTSFTLGDSLDYQYDVCGSTLDAPTFNGAFYNCDMDKLLDSTKSPGDRLVSTFNSSDRYLEIQIHGKENHSADIIEKVYFTKGAASRAKSSGLLNKLDAKKIPYEVLD